MKKLNIAILASLSSMNALADNTSMVTAGNAFNPAMSLIINGLYYDNTAKGKIPPLQSSFAAEGEPLDRGFNLGESELVLSATVDPYWDAHLTAIFDGAGAAEIEEAWAETRQLPFGLKARIGKMKSDAGYLSSQHPHAWDFADATLPYQAMLGGEGLSDTGARIEWLPSLPIYTLLGAEAFQGKQDVFGKTELTEDESGAMEAATSSVETPETKSGPRLWTAFAKFSPELGDDHSLQLGLSVMKARQQLWLGQTGAISPDFYLSNGDARIEGADLVYKYYGNADGGKGNIKIQAEWLQAQRDGKVFSSDDTSNAPIGASASGKQSGYYVQALYGFAPRWQAAVRSDRTSGEQTSADGATSDIGSSSRMSYAINFLPTEFSTLRLQVNRVHSADDGDVTTRDHYSEIFIQYIMSLGTHGAHKF